MKVILRFALGIALFLFCGITTADVFFFDGQFDPASWTLTTQGDGTVESEQVTGGGIPGNPDPYFHVATQPTATSGSTVFGYLFQTDFVYDPGNLGPVVSVEWSFDFQNITSAQLMGLAMEQDGIFYTTDSAVRNGSFGTWTPGGSTIEASELPAGLDLSAGGSPITFGFFTANTFNPAFGDNPNTIGYDNLQIIVSQVPEPAMGSLVLMSFLAILPRRNRRRCPLA